MPKTAFTEASPINPSDTSNQNPIEPISNNVDIGNNQNTPSAYLDSPIIMMSPASNNLVVPTDPLCVVKKQLCQT
jgi:hypothetical protein